jgi:hypothetical protein
VFHHSFIWDLDDDPDGNVSHCAEHRVTKEEVEEVFHQFEDIDIRRSSGRPVLFGDTSAGRYLIVVYEIVDEDSVYLITACDVPRSKKP